MTNKIRGYPLQSAKRQLQAERSVLTRDEAKSPHIQNPEILDKDQKGILVIADIPMANASGMETRIAADNRGFSNAWLEAQFPLGSHRSPQPTLRAIFLRASEAHPVSIVVSH